MPDAEKSTGIKYPPDTRFQEERGSIPYEETEHQLMAINEVKKTWKRKTHGSPDLWRRRVW
jgi:transcription-repair coupling factor (superfamily II helicase)